MGRVLQRIATRRQELVAKPFFRELLDNPDLSPRQRMSWVPATIPFVMGYLDLNESFLRDHDRDGDPVQAQLNHHSYEEDYHWLWFLDDLEALGMDVRLSLCEAVHFLWGPDLNAARRLPIELASLIRHSVPVERLVIVQVIEDVSLAIFSRTKEIPFGAETPLMFFGQTHYDAEAGHELHGPAALSLQEDLDPEREAELLTLVDTVFALFDAWFADLHRFGLA
jgi:hypothetical protein